MPALHWCTMPYDDLQDFLKVLEQAGELKRVRAEVDPVLEVAEIADRVSKAEVEKPEARSQKPELRNQALLFEKVQGSGVPLAINTFGSYKRMHMALGCESFDELAGKIAELTRPEVPAGIWNKIRKGMDFLKIGSYVP